MENYVKLAIRTENTDFTGIGSRLEEQSEKVLPALNKAILALQELDYTVKKECFYGKPAKYYDAPLFQKAGDLTPEQKAVLNSESFIRLLHGFMGIATEAGEGLEALARYFQTGELDKVNVGEELGDCFWYQAIIADECGAEFETEQQKNIAKLKARYGQAFSAENASRRDLDNERRVLES
jgi:NTP pyrophosphatase (non-canonical NTP hydrolase)